ncbi:uncharacterized protein LOC119579665 [Penaeus monodon]|uniref:uncharacterized protein LOC119579665 n=1 Tax=Penaeus monodon TaxID=6687 RepID=UPI0018A7465C|nr:uncharacterized protein LOC119579665 [Penaeus monodon]
MSEANSRPWLPGAPTSTPSRGGPVVSSGVSNRFEVLGTLQDPAELWDTINRETLSAAGEYLGVRPRRRRRVVSDETLNTIEMRHVAKLDGNHVLHRELSCSVRASLRMDQRRYARGIVEELEGHFAQNDLRPAFRALRELRSNSISHLGSVRTEDGRVLSELGEYRACWAKYFELLYRVNLPTSQLPLAGTQPLVADPSISEAPPSTEEARRAASRPKSGMADGVYGVALGLLKASEEAMICKVLSHLLLARVCLRAQRPEQSGFTPKNAPGESLEPVGSLWDPPWDYWFAVWSVYRYRECCQVWMGGISDFFPVSAGMRQGCVLAQALSILAWTGYLAVPWLCRSSCGASIVKLAETLEVLEIALETLHEEAKLLELSVNWTKTKVQEFGGLLYVDVQFVHVCGENINILDSFTYLGNVVQSDRGPDRECSEGTTRLPWAKYIRRIMGYTWRDHVSNQRTLHETDSRPITSLIREHQLQLFWACGSFS